MTLSGFVVLYEASWESWRYVNRERREAAESGGEEIASSEDDDILQNEPVRVFARPLMIFH